MAPGERANLSFEESVRVPLFVYRYASLGALGYVFTKMMAEIGRDDDRDHLENLAGDCESPRRGSSPPDSTSS